MCYHRRTRAHFFLPGSEQNDSKIQVRHQNAFRVSKRVVIKKNEFYETIFLRSKYKLAGIFLCKIRRLRNIYRSLFRSIRTFISLLSYSFAGKWERVGKQILTAVGELRGECRTIEVCRHHKVGSLTAVWPIKSSEPSFSNIVSSVLIQSKV